MTQLLFVCMNVAAILIADRGIADPAPGIPGNSGNQNPHGAPPGQGGTAPGNSGTSNPHGTPPGQRIPPPGSPPASGVSSGSGHVGASGPSSIQSGSGAGEPDAQALRGAQRAAEHDQDAFIAELARLKGWEPDWMRLALTYETVGVEAIFRQSTVGGTVYERSTSWRKDGTRELGRTVYPGPEQSDWRFEGGRYFQRWELAPWKEFPTGLRTPRIHVPLGRHILAAWESEPGTIHREAGGRLIYRLPRWDRTGTIELEVDAGSPMVLAIRRLGETGRLVWHEVRDVSLQEGRVVLRRRERRLFEPAGIVQEETCRWSFGAAVNFAEALVALEAR